MDTLTIRKSDRINYILHQPKKKNYNKIRTSSTARLAVKGSKGLSTIACGRIASALTFYTPVSAVLLTSRGLDDSEIFTLESVLLLSILLVEMPSGVWRIKLIESADYIGFVLSAVSNIVYALGQGFAWYAVFYNMSGFSIALISSILEAYVYESLNKDADKLAIGVFGFCKSLELISGVLASLCESYLAHLNISFPTCPTAMVLRLPSIPGNNSKHSTCMRSLLQDLIKGQVY